MTKNRKTCRTLVAITAIAALAGGAAFAHPQNGPGTPRVIEVLADSDSRYKVAGENTPKITLKAGEQFLLRVMARRAKSWNRDGSIHGFTLLHAKDRTRVPGWDLLFKPGKQEFLLTAPSEAGDYVVVCTVVCSEDHEGMSMKFTVLP